MKSQSYKTIKQFASRFCASRRGRLRRMLLSALFASGSIVAAVSPAVSAEGPPVHLGGISILVHEFTPDNAVMLSPSEELDTLAESLPVHRTSSQFNQAIAAAVSTSAERIGISVEQFLEPYALVGQLSSSPYSAKSTASAPLATTLLELPPVAQQQPETVVAIPTQQQQLDDLAALNCWWFDENMVDWLTEITEMEKSTADLAAAPSTDVVMDVEPLIGSAPVIATIPDAYFPYDFAQRDLELEYLPLTTVQPIHPKNYVSLIPQTDAEEVASEVTEIAVSEPAVESSPDCVLDELLHSARKFAERSELHALTLAKCGESLGEWLASSTDGSARRELALSIDLADDSPAAAATEQVAADETEAPAIEELVVAETEAPAIEEVAVAETEAPAIEEVAVAEIVSLEIEGVEIDAPVVEEVTDAPAAKQLVVEQPETPAIDPVAVVVTEQVDVAELATMEIAGELVPAPVADDAPNAMAIEQLVSDESEVPATVEIAVAQIVAIGVTEEDVAEEDVAALIIDEVEDNAPAPQLVVNEIVAPENTSTADGEPSLGTPFEAFTLPQLMEMVNQWKQRAVASIMTPRNLSSLPQSEVAEKQDASNENVIR